MNGHACKCRTSSFSLISRSKSLVPLSVLHMAPVSLLTDCRSRGQPNTVATPSFAVSSTAHSTNLHAGQTYQPDTLGQSSAISVQGAGNIGKHELRVLLALAGMAGVKGRRNVSGSGSDLENDPHFRYWKDQYMRLIANLGTHRNTMSGASNMSMAGTKNGTANTGSAPATHGQSAHSPSVSTFAGRRPTSLESFYPHVYQSDTSLGTTQGRALQSTASGNSDKPQGWFGRIHNCASSVYNGAKSCNFGTSTKLSSAEPLQSSDPMLSSRHTQGTQQTSGGSHTLHATESAQPLHSMQDSQHALVQEPESTVPTQKASFVSSAAKTALGIGLSWGGKCLLNTGLSLAGSYLKNRFGT